MLCILQTLWGSFKGGMGESREI